MYWASQPFRRRQELLMKRAQDKIRDRSGRKRGRQGDQPVEMTRSVRGLTLDEAFIALLIADLVIELGTRHQEAILGGRCIV
jgi:hypothetical protein